MSFCCINPFVNVESKEFPNAPPFMNLPPIDEILLVVDYKFLDGS